MAALNWINMGAERYLAGAFEVRKLQLYWHVYVLHDDGARIRQDSEGFHSATDAMAFAEDLPAAT